MNEMSADAPLAKCIVQPKYITRWQAETPSAETGGEFAFVHQKARPLRGRLRRGTNYDL
jgi:hypothetical protein